MSDTSTLLSIIYGTSSGSGSGTDPIVALQQAEANETKDVAATAKQPTIARDIAKFTAAVTSATSISSLLKNPDFLKVFMTANDLGDQISFTALAQKALMSDPNDSSSLANKLSDTSWKSTVQAYDFFDKGLSTIQTSSAISTLTDAYAEVTWRNSLDATTPGLSNALAFRATASTLTSVDQILGNPTARAVVTGAYNIPQQIAYQQLEAQERAITSNLDISRLQDPKYVDQVTDQYLINTAQSSTSTGSTTDITALAIQADGLLA